MIIFFEFPANLAFQKEENYKQLPSSFPDRDYYLLEKKEITSTQGSKINENDTGLLCSSESS